MNFGGLVRKVHRVLAIPMFVLVLAKIISSGTFYEGVIQKMTEVTMIVMLLSGIVMYVKTAKRSKR